MLIKKNTIKNIEAVGFCINLSLGRNKILITSFHDVEWKAPAGAA